MNILLNKKQTVCKQGDFKTKSAMLSAVTAQFTKREWGSTSFSIVIGY